MPWWQQKVWGSGPVISVILWKTVKNIGNFYSFRTRRLLRAGDRRRPQGGHDHRPKRRLHRAGNRGSALRRETADRPGADRHRDRRQRAGDPLPRPEEKRGGRGRKGRSILKNDHPIIPLYHTGKGAESEIPPPFRIRLPDGGLRRPFTDNARSSPPPFSFSGGRDPLPRRSRRPPPAARALPRRQLPLRPSR